MNYSKVYDQIIAKAKARVKAPGYEGHHIVPESLGGPDTKDNLVYLTYREHFIAHYLLAKIHGGTQWVAVKMFKNNRYRNSRLFEIARVKSNQAMAKLMEGNQHGLGRKRSQASKQKTSLSLMGNKNGLGKYWKHSEINKQKISFGMQAAKLNRLMDSIWATA